MFIGNHNINDCNYKQLKIFQVLSINSLQSMISVIIGVNKEKFLLKTLEIFILN